MRSIINYIRSCFCKHEWELVKEIRTHGRDENGKIEQMPDGGVIIYRCVKCGWFRKLKF